MNFTTRACIACAKIIRGRADKKFCNDQCRNTYNNRMRLPESACVRSITQSIRRNRSILDKLLGNLNRAIVQRELLLEHGFMFRYHTHTENQQGEHLICCYDVAYRPEKNDHVMVQRLYEEE